MRRALFVSLLLGAPGCDAAPQTSVVVDNRYPPFGVSPRVVYDAQWEAVSFAGSPVSPGSSSAVQSTVPASATAAYVVVAPGWDPSGAAPPASLVVMRSRAGFEAHLGDTLHIPVDDTTFDGNCSAGSSLAQDEADFITRIVFAGDFAGLRYDAATCTTTAIDEADAR